ncbi:choline-sulfatase [Shimia gijangensis]|uniref:Choline-sulfatase n=1 Tax=Shimia gijangensis TaxID=1470563 RepID=A0A1M6I9F4_9RHOB|nr:choline-sulfatase [Shimia gijangensis]SHJ31003.1 choline-sulfatase [Shimia gijangensis]
MPATRPNILVIQADQLAAQALSLYGGAAKTPNLDRLASEGTVFRNFYCNYPLCGPSRGSMLTGQLASKVGVYDNAAELPASEPTFAHFLRRAGYHTCLSGKMHFVGPDQLHGFEERLTAEIYPADFAWLPDWTTGEKGFEPMRNTIENGGVCAWNMQIAFDEEATQKSVHKLFEYARAPDDPFFLFVSLSHPHHPFLTQPEYWEMYREEEVPEPTVDRLPDANLDPHSQRCRKMIGLDHSDVSADHARQARHAYYGSISYFDAKVGQIIEALEASGLKDDTAIIVTADHGEMLGERGLWAKDCFFEWAMRVPLIVHLPGQSQTPMVEQNTSLMDLLPTFLDIAGADVGQDHCNQDHCDLEGASLLGLVTGAAEDWSDEILAEYTADATTTPIIMIRKGPYKYIASTDDPEMLFDLRVDPNELNNLAEHADSAELLSQFRARQAEVWDLPRLNDKIRRSQKKRDVVRDALKQGRAEPWDFIPKPDYSDTYVRSANSHEVIDRKVRLPAKGYPLPKNH